MSEASEYPNAAVTWHQLSPRIRQMRQSEPIFMDNRRRAGVCGVQAWIEFPDPETAQQFREAMYAFARDWTGAPVEQKGK